ALLAGAAFAAYASQAAYADSLEERLRTQLRSTTQQLQALQTEQAQATAAKAALESQRDAALAQVKQLSAELARAK
ncbi:DNA repair protein, partial [Pseudomonas aeruginosa]|nr:DNA repair protein [Pseudomonas aeruginosa]